MQVGMGSSCYSLQTEGFGELSPATATAGFSADNGGGRTQHLCFALLPILLTTLGHIPWSSCCLLAPRSVK